MQNSMKLAIGLASRTPSGLADLRLLLVTVFSASGLAYHRLLLVMV